MTTDSLRQSPSQCSRILQRRRTESFQKLADQIDTSLRNDSKFLYLGVDTVFSLKPGSEFVWDWVRCRSDNVSSQTLLISMDSVPHRVHRIMLIQRPDEIPNLWDRKKLREQAALLAHMHCWDGAVIYAVFISSKNRLPGKIQEFFQLWVLPRRIATARTAHHSPSEVMDAEVRWSRGTHSARGAVVSSRRLAPTRRTRTPLCVFHLGTTCLL